MRAARVLLSVLAVAVFAAPFLTAQSRTSDTLDIYLIDVEGGNATLFVSPSGESLLIDTGHASDVDVDRIVAAATDAGLAQIDHVISTHYHGDHMGGLAGLTQRLPVKHFIDHGPNVQPGGGERLEQAYAALHAQAKRTAVKAGDVIPMADLDVRVVASAGETIRTPLSGTGVPNAYCASYEPTPHQVFLEDQQSVGALITFGNFRTIHLGDLTSDKEFELVCPNNKLGTIDVLLGLHHGQPTSSTKAFVHAIRPRVAILNNGTRKGALPEVMETLYSSPGLEDVWLAHFSLLSGQEYTVPGLFIANLVDDQAPVMPIAPMVPPARGSGAPPPPAHDGPAYWIKVSAQQDGSYTVTNARNGFVKTYPAGT